TYGHSERVTYFAKEIGQRLNLPRQDLQLLEYGAFLHDIGKLEISREILNKKDGLLEEDWNIIRQHPQWGAEILKSVASLKPAIPMVLYHHENYDGTGYPFGLKGDEIPLFARILRVADSFDAIVSNRPYSSPMAQEEALKELARCSGSQYDPQIVAVFLEVMKSIKLY
ncbi:MAG TPA: HD-GYP domain-containing protein, partial [Firmicutes bacterium]|nr:HD-GYP domain-containing protein [Bacillota bacterium]